MNQPDQTNKTYWIDLTDLSIWRGHFTGIQRVVYQLAKYYAADGARFFTYDDQHKTFHEVQFKIIQPPKLDRSEKVERRKAQKEALKYHLKAAYQMLPLDVRQSLTPRLKPLAGKLYHKAHHYRHLTQQALTRPPRVLRQDEITFGANDVVLIFGAGWARPSILNELWRRKQQAGFKIFHFVHDMIPVYFPHLFGPGHFELSVDYFFDVASVCDGIITNSESSKRDMAKFCEQLNLPKPPIDVVRLGDELELTDEPVAPKADLVPGEFILCHGTIEIRKNHALIYYAYKLAQERGIDMPKLVISGRPGWLSHDIVFAMKLDPILSQKVVIFSPHDSELAWLLKNCRYAIYPSVYEGWGLPIAEALVMGKLCLTSNVSSMPEIAGNLIDYFSPYNSAECLEVMTRYLDDDKLRAKEAAIKQDYQIQTWCATYNAIQEAVTKQLAASAEK